VRSAWTALRPGRLDVAVAAAVTALAVLELLAGPARAAASSATVALTVLTTVPLAWRRTSPVGFAVASAAAFALGSLLLPTVEVFVAGVVAFLVGPFTVAARAAGWRRAVGVGALVAVLLALQGVWDERFGAFGAALANVVYAVLGWSVGAVVRLVEQRSSERVARAEREAAAAVRAERAAMARDLHDVVSNALTVVAVQSGGALSVLDAEPEQARRSLEDIREVSRRALVDMRHLLGLLRDEAGADGTGVDHAVRGPGLDRLEELVEPVRRSGVRVDVERAGSPVPLTPGTETTAVRVLQEALTNVVRHSGAHRAVLQVRWEPDGLGLSVVDDGPVMAGPAVAPSRSGGGHGLVGMRERVDLLGGRLEVGPGDRGGWAVRAWLPVVRVTA
jgi:signal transduction histidine kinase